MNQLGKKMCKGFAEASLKCDAHTICRWVLYQPVEPKGLKERFRKEKSE